MRQIALPCCTPDRRSIAASGPASPPPCAELLIDRGLFRQPKMGRPIAAQALTVCLVALAVCAAGQASDISLSGVEVALLESGGSVAASHALSGPAKLELVLDHTRTLKVSADGAGAGRRRVGGGGGGRATSLELVLCACPCCLLPYHSPPSPPAAHTNKTHRCRSRRRSRAATPTSGRSRRWCA